MTTLNTDLRNKKIDTINELIQVTRDSADFYFEAAKDVDNPNLRSLFERMAESKNKMVGALSTEVRAEGAQPAKDGTFAGSLRQMYGGLKAKIQSDKGDYAYVSELEESEDRMLHAFEDVLKKDNTPSEVRESLRSFLPEVKAQHDLMRDRKWAMQTRH